MAERQRADQQARHDLVADAEIDGGVEHLVRQRDRGRKRDHVAREQGELHARLALRDAVAHGGHAARDLRRAARRARRALDDLGEALVGLMGRQHVVVGGDDREVRRVAALQRFLVVGAAGGKTVGEIGAAEFFSGRPRIYGLGDAIEIAAARVAAALDEALGDFADARVQG